MLNRSKAFRVTLKSRAVDGQRELACQRSAGGIGRVNRDARRGERKRQEVCWDAEGGYPNIDRRDIRDQTRRTFAMSCVALTKVVGSAEPFHWTVELALMPVPFTVSVNAAPPMETVEGFRLVRL